MDGRGLGPPASSPDPELTERFQMVWPAWLSVRVREAADERTIAIAAWLREAAIEKLKRDRA